MDWPATAAEVNGPIMASPASLTTNVLYVGDSLFADLVDAKREFGWTTAAVTPEVGYEMEMQNQADYALAGRTVELLLHALRLLQTELGATLRTEEDLRVMDALERLVSRWRDRETMLLGSPFGSVFRYVEIGCPDDLLPKSSAAQLMICLCLSSLCYIRARYQPSLFAHSLRRYCDLYFSDIAALRNVSPQVRNYRALGMVSCRGDFPSSAIQLLFLFAFPLFVYITTQHRFYPEQATRLLAHEIQGGEPVCWDLDEMEASDDAD